MNWAVCKTPWSHRIFYTTYCQFSRASGLVLRKGKNPPPEPSLPLPRLKLGTFAALGVSPARWGAGCPRQLSPGLVSGSSSAFASPAPPGCALPSAGSPLATVPQGCPHLTHSPWCPAHPFHRDIFPAVFPDVSSCWWLFQALHPHPAVPLGTLQCLSHSWWELAGRHRALWGPLSSAALLQCLASIRNPEFLQRNPIPVLITPFVWGNFFPL